MFNFHGFKDNSILFMNKNIKKKTQRDIISTKEAIIRSKVDGVKRGAVSMEEVVFLDKKSDEGEHLYPNLKDKDEYCIYEIFSNFRKQLETAKKKLEENRKTNPRLRYDTNHNETEEDSVTYGVNRNNIYMNRFIDIDRTTDIITCIDTM